MTPILQQFHPVIARWFKQLGEPTEVQTKAWPVIARGTHCLITAPTGSGKTLTAFLWAINRFATRDLASGHTRILYVSPLKALNNDIRNNLMQPLNELRDLFTQQGEVFPDIRVQTRSGDTDATERRQMLRRPPEILITTPESLNLLLSSKGGMAMLRQLDTVILDEIHSVIDNKRGAYLISAVERLVALSGEFQRIALSATIQPLAMAADFVGGYQISNAQDSRGHLPTYQKRQVELIESHQQKQYDVEICYPDSIASKATDKNLWDTLASELVEKIQHNRATLIFVNSRALCEKLTHKINVAADQTIAYAHHGSLSREIRFEVEQRLKKGELAAIVATGSLEMGIDIGSLDEVFIIQGAGSMASAIQRIGRAGHKVGQISKGKLYPTHPQDFIEAVVLAKAVQDKDSEPVKPVSCPLDVLAQVIISMTSQQSWDLDELYIQIKTSSVFHSLSRTQFDLIIQMLAGRYADNRIQELKPRVSIDRLDNTIIAKPGAVLALYSSGGVIPDRGYFQLRHFENSARIGELDEEFVWEARIGQLFTLGTQYWKIQKITHNDVFVVAGKPGAVPPPFWKAEAQSRNFYFSERILTFLEDANSLLTTPGSFHNTLSVQYQISAEAIQVLNDYLTRQRAHTRCDLPHRHHLVIEQINSMLGHSQGNQLVIHTGWGAPVNRPWALAMEAAWWTRFGNQIEIYASNDSLVLQLPDEVRPEELLTLVELSQLERLLRQRLEGSGFFGARFRECAGRALLLNKGKFRQRQPLWMSRLQSQKLLESVLAYEDFPLLLETWRTCLLDEFDLDTLRNLLIEVESGQLRWSSTVTSTPSPMARNIAWDQVNQYMYMDDSPKSSTTSKLRDELLQELVFNPQARPTISKAVCDSFYQHRVRLNNGYAPESAADLLDWVKERVVIPTEEWGRLIKQIAQQTSVKESTTLLQTISEKVVKLNRDNSELIVALENLAKVTSGFYLHDGRYSVKPLNSQQSLAEYVEPHPEHADILLETQILNFLQFYGPITFADLLELLSIDQVRLQETINDLYEAHALVTGALLEDNDEIYLCERNNFEQLIYLQRKTDSPDFKPLDLANLPLFLNTWQRLNSQHEDKLEQLFELIKQLQCHPLPAELWETEILPARMQQYQPYLLDQIFQETDLHWIGQQYNKIAFCFDSDLDLLSTDNSVSTSQPVIRQSEESLATLFPDPLGRYDLAGLTKFTSWDISKVSKKLWQHVWHSQISNDSYTALRKGIESKFEVPEFTAPVNISRTRNSRRTVKNLGFAQWKKASPNIGNWYRLPMNHADDEDPLEDLENNKDRVRLLLRRYGIVFRELLHKEPLAFRWGTLFKALRLMELSREIVSGYFFKDIPGPQFLSHQALRILQNTLPEQQIFWHNACDPISMCGIALPALKSSLPRRLESNHIVYRGAKVILVSQRFGKELFFYISHEDPEIQTCMVFLRHLLNRPVKPFNQLHLETINNEPAAHSVYLGCLQNGFDLYRDHKQVILQRNN